MRFFIFAVLLSWESAVFAKNGAELAIETNINPSTKAIRQWERIFNKRSKWSRYGLDKLNDLDREILKKYVLDHAADSDRPAAAGIY
jgi:hypothetical protein